MQRHTQIGDTARVGACAGGPQAQNDDAKEESIYDSILGDTHEKRQQRMNKAFFDRLCSLSEIDGTDPCFGTALQCYRIRLGISQHAFATMVGIPKHLLHDIEIRIVSLIKRSIISPEPRCRGARPASLVVIASNNYNFGEYTLINKRGAPTPQSQAATKPLTQSANLRAGGTTARLQYTAGLCMHVSLCGHGHEWAYS